MKEQNLTRQEAGKEAGVQMTEKKVDLLLTWLEKA